MASSELLPPAPLAIACDADGVLASPAEKRSEGSPGMRHESFYHVAVKTQEQRGLIPLWFKAPSVRWMPRVGASQKKDQQHLPSESRDAPQSELFF